MPKFIHDEITPELAALVLDQLGREPLHEVEREALLKGQESQAEDHGQDGDPVERDALTGLGATDGPVPDVLAGEDVMRARMCGRPVPAKGPALRGRDLMQARMRGQR